MTHPLCCNYRRFSRPCFRPSTEGSDYCPECEREAMAIEDQEGPCRMTTPIRPIRACAVCSRSGCKLFRPYGEFLREERIVCRQHIPKGEEGWYAPMVEDADGSVWGYTSVPQPDVEAWEALPE